MLPLVGESEELPVVLVPVGAVEDVEALPPALLVPVPLVLVDVPPPYVLVPDAVPLPKLVVLL